MERHPVGRLVLDRIPDNFFAETEQVAFCTQNIVPGIDFTNDPLLQGRNFSYLDTQIKRLGGPNFTHIPINAPKCPFAHFQQDGHMAMTNPKGRANYEPNSWTPELGADGGPRETTAGFKSYPDEVSGDKRRVRPESFADHYSQARQFYIGQTDIEQGHIQDALVFELSRVERPDIRRRVVSHLLNIDETLAQAVADGLGLTALPTPAQAARPTRQDLPPSDALSIQKTNRGTLQGRKFGVLLTDGADAGLFTALVAAANEAGAVVEVVTPKIGGVTLSDGSPVESQYKIDGGPSVIFDFPVVLASAAGVEALVKLPPARDFVADAFAHFKFLAYSADTLALIEKAGIAKDLDEGCFELTGETLGGYIAALAEIRYWPREDAMKAMPPATKA